MYDQERSGARRTSLPEGHRKLDSYSAMLAGEGLQGVDDIRLGDGPRNINPDFTKTYVAEL